MVSVVAERHRARTRRSTGSTVGGKTGTAQNGEAAQDHGWFIGFAMKDGKPIAAVAVFLENGRSGRQRRGRPDRRPDHEGVIDERGK